MWQIDGEEDCVLTWGGLRVRYGDAFRDNNPCSDVWLNSKKSAEVVVPEWLQTLREGPNNRRF
jgi:hypothetical protein